MARKASRRPGGEPAGGKTVKVTLTLPYELAQRLAVEAGMRRVSQSTVAAEILGPPLKRWRLPSTIEDGPVKPADPAGREGVA
jgi:hypothetical protein